MDDVLEQIEGVTQQPGVGRDLAEILTAQHNHGDHHARPLQ
jgi:hypothetical protein